VKIILAGTIGRSGLGGQAWASLQYLLGFRALGHEVLYLEDCGQSSWVYDWGKQEWTTELEYPASYVQRCLARFGLGNRWAYRTDDGCLGLSLDTLQDFCANADLLLMRAVPLWVWRDEYDLPRHRAFIDVDPGFTQVSLANGDKGFALGISRAETCFTFGQRIGLPDCPIPTHGGPWLKTLPPVYLDEWPVQIQPGSRFTSIIRWQGFREANYNGVALGQRDQEFLKYLQLPLQQTQSLCLAMMGAKPDTLTRHGWEVLPGEIVSETPDSYRAFIQQSRAEFGVPKHGYVSSRSGWFSDRSVCYLSSGRPVLIEDSGLKDWLPVGEGVVTFDDMPSAVAGIKEINSDYDRHQQAARKLAEEYFSTEKVLTALLTDAIN